MSIPNRKSARIDKRKLTGFLLNPQHPDAKGKARFFTKYYGDDWERLRNDLLRHASDPTTKTEETPFGTHCVIESKLPDSASSATVRAVWIVRTGEDFPRLIRPIQSTDLLWSLKN